MIPQKTFRQCIGIALVLSIAIFAVNANANANADVVVIVSAKSSITRLSAEQTTKIFLGKTDNPESDTILLPIDQSEGNAIRDEFYAKVVRKSASQVTAYWAKVIFTGDGQPPGRLGGDAAVRKAIANNPNAIGYVDKNSVDDSVRIVFAP